MPGLRRALSVYYFGKESDLPATRVTIGNSNPADVATPFDDNGTGTTTQ